MDTTLRETLDEVRTQSHEIASTQLAHGEQLSILVEQSAEIIKLLTPDKGDGPTLEEMLGHIIGQLTELTAFSRQQVKMLSAMEQNMPGDVARAVVSAANGAAGRNGAGAAANAGARG